MHCLVDEKHVVHNAAKGVPQNVIIDGERISIKNTDLYKSVLEAEGKRILWSRTLSSASTTRVSISPPRNKPRPSWGARTPRYGSWVTMCAHWPSVIIDCRVYKGEEDISLWSEKDSHESHKWVSELVRINPFERTISRWTLDEQGVVHLLYHRQCGEQGQSKITGNQRLPSYLWLPESSIVLTRFWAKICSIPTNGVRESTDFMGARGGEAVWHGQQRADGNYGDFGAKKGGQEFSRSTRRRCSAKVKFAHLISYEHQRIQVVHGQQRRAMEEGIWGVTLADKNLRTIHINTNYSVDFPLLSNNNSLFVLILLSTNR